MPNPDPEQVLADIRASARIGAEIRQLTANLRRSISKNWHACADQEEQQPPQRASDDALRGGKGSGIRIHALGLVLRCAEDP